MKPGRAGAFYLMFIGLMLALVGGIFVWLLLRSYGNANDTRKWSEVPCLIIRSEVTERVAENISPEFRWEVAYKYQYKEEDFIGSKLGPRGQKWSREKAKAEVWLEEYPMDSKQVCFVNPEEPEVAILEHDTKAAGYTVWFPGLFVLGGVGIMVGAVRGLFK